VLHLLKNLKQTLINNTFFILSDKFVAKYKLPSRIKHFDKLIKAQNNFF